MAQIQMMIICKRREDYGEVGGGTDGLKSGFPFPSPLQTAQHSLLQKTHLIM